MANWDQINTTFQSVLADNGSDADFVLRSGESFTIKASQGHRTDPELTDGLSQKQVRIRISALDWEAVAPVGRIPEKGDKVTMWGRKHTVENAHPRGAAGRTLVYVLVMRG